MDADQTPAIAFAVTEHALPAVEVRVNFGVFAGRAATPAEIDRLAAWLLDEVGDVSIISEVRHEISAETEASVHQVRVELAPDRVPMAGSERAALERRVLDRVEHWARLCVAERHAEISEGL